MVVEKLPERVINIHGPKIGDKPFLHSTTEEILSHLQDKNVKFKSIITPFSVTMLSGRPVQSESVTDSAIKRERKKKILKIIYIH